MGLQPGIGPTRSFGATIRPQSRLAEYFVKLSALGQGGEGGVQLAGQGRTTFSADAGAGTFADDFTSRGTAPLASKLLPWA